MRVPLWPGTDEEPIRTLARHGNKLWPAMTMGRKAEVHADLRSIPKLGFDKSMDQSNYAVQVTPETCKGCGLCVKRCPMDAIQMKFSAESTNKFRKAVVVDTDLCIGCGVCVHKCPAESIILKRREIITRPPKDGRELMRTNYMARQAAG